MALGHYFRYFRGPELSELLKGFLKGDIDIGTDIDVDMDIDLDAPGEPVAHNYGLLEV